MRNWDACQNHHSPWSHNTIFDLEVYGLKYFAHCSLGDAQRPVKIITILRHPQDRFVSALRYFDQIRKQRASVRRVMTRPASVDLAFLRNLTMAIFSDDPAVKPEVRLHEYVDIFSSLASVNHIPYPLDQATRTRLKKAEKERSGGADHEILSVRPKRYNAMLPPPQGHVELAKDMLSKHFIVGITEKFSSFLALISLTFNWSPNNMCLPFPCQLKHGSGHYNCSTAGQHMKELTPLVINEINRLVAPDLEVYEHAKRLHERQIASFKEAFDERLAIFHDASYLNDCEMQRPELKKRCKSMR